MRRTSLFFVLIGIAALFFADISVTTLDPWQEIQRLIFGLLTPDFTSQPALFRALFNTVSFAILGLSGAIVFGSILALFFEYTPVRLFSSFIRSVHELFWAFILMPFIGLNGVCGMLAIAIPYAGIFAKVYAEIAQEADTLPSQNLPVDASRLSNFFYTTLPVIYTDIKNYTSYRFECALRSSAILGFIGLPTIGYYLETAFREGMYSEAAALLFCFYLLIISLQIWARPKFIVIPLLIAALFTSWETSVSFANISRFLTYDILPWPMRAEGFYDGSQVVQFHLAQTFLWFKEIMVTEALPGIWNTLILSQIALVCTGLFALLSFPAACRHFSGPVGVKTNHLLLVILRTTPEYILAYIFLQLWGPSMLPAIWALFLHNGAILAYLSVRNADLITLPFDASQGKINRYFFELLPRMYGRFLAFLFYRWEIIMRESAILGILGIHTLGFYIDSAISVDHLDKALLLIIITALLNMVIDSCSQTIRKRLKISTKLLPSKLTTS